MPRGRLSTSRYGDPRAAQESAFGFPSVSTGSTSLGSNLVTKFVTQSDDCLGHLYFCRWNLRALPVRIFDDAGNGGYGTLKIADMPLGYFNLLSAKSNLSRIQRTNTATAGTGIAADFDGDYSFGSAALGAAFATLDSTKGNFIPTTSTTQAASGISAGGTNRFRDVTAGASTLLDNTGGTAGLTLTTIVTGATILASTQNDIASLAKEFNDLVGETFPTLEIDGSNTAVDVILNMVVDDADQDGGGDNGIAGDLLVTGYLEMLFLLV